MQQAEIIELIQRELPRMIQTQPALQAMVIDLARTAFAPKQQTEDRIERLYAKLVQMQEKSEITLAINERRWEEQKAEDKRKWDEQKAEDKRKWDEHKAEDKLKWEEQNRRWDEHKAEDKLKWEEQNRRWDEHKAEDKLKWDEQNRKWSEYKMEEKRKSEEFNAKFQLMHEEIMTISQRHERSIGALGARWGLQTEKAFRHALAAILEKSFGVEVLNINEYDDTGTVFGRPDQVELDIIIKNGVLIAAEIKSSIDKAGMYIFERKVRFYEQRHQRTAQRMMVISPMVDPKAMPVAQKLGIEVYSDSVDVKSL